DAEGLQRQANHVAQLTTAALSEVSKGKEPVALERGLVDAAATALGAIYDKTYGGFGSPGHNFQGAKVPMPTNLSLLQQHGRGSMNALTPDIVATTLEHMAQGGIYDQLGGGFHRYSTERTWTVPHFEKMLYDNAQLLEVYALELTRTK